MRRVPEHAQRPLAAGVIPDARCEDSVRAGDPRHLSKARHRVAHEVDDELRQRGIEALVLERQLLRCRAGHVHRGVAGAGRCDEPLRGVDGRHAVRTEPRDKLGGQRPGTATDVEHALAGVHAEKSASRGASGAE